MRQTYTYRLEAPLVVANSLKIESSRNGKLRE